MDPDDPDQSLPCSGKLAFDSRREAQAAATVAQYRYGNQLYVYRCQHCGLWHLSSTSPD